MARKTEATAEQRRRPRKSNGFVIQVLGTGGTWTDLTDNSAPLLDGSSGGDPMKFKFTAQAMQHLRTITKPGEYRICAVTQIVAIEVETVKKTTLKVV